MPAYFPSQVIVKDRKWRRDGVVGPCSLTTIAERVHCTLSLILGLWPGVKAKT